MLQGVSPEHRAISYPPSDTARKPNMSNSHTPDTEVQAAARNARIATAFEGALSSQIDIVGRATDADEPDNASEPSD